MAQADQNGSMTLRDYWRVVWLRRRMVAAIVVLFTLAAFGVAMTQSEVYMATARLMYDPPADVANISSGYTDLNRVDFEVQSVVNTVSTPAVAKRASTLLEASDRQLPYTVSASVVVSSESTVAEVVDVTAEAGSAALAAGVANAYARAIIDLRKESEQESLRKAQRIVQDQLNTYQTAQARLTGDYLELRQQLSNLRIAEASANGDFDIIVPATPPPSPASPKPVRSAVFGFIAGGFFAVVLAFVIGQFDTRVRSHRAVSDIVGLPVIGRVPRMTRRAIEDGGLVALSDPRGSVSEALRVLRRNLEWSGIDGSLKTLVVTSFVKGDGKTLTLCNLAVTLARAGSKVVIVDADLRDPQVHRVFRLPNAIGLTSVVLGKTPLAEAVKEFKATGSSISSSGDGLPAPRDGVWAGTLMVLTSGPLPPNPGEVVASRSVAKALAELAASNADYVLIDTPPVLGFSDAGSLAPSADAMLVTVGMEKARRPVLEEGREVLDAMPGRKVGVVIVGERIDDTQYAGYSSSGSGQ